MISVNNVNLTYFTKTKNIELNKVIIQEFQGKFINNNRNYFQIETREVIVINKYNEILSNNNINFSKMILFYVMTKCLIL